MDSIFGSFNGPRPCGCLVLSFTLKLLVWRVWEGIQKLLFKENLHINGGLNGLQQRTEVL